MDITKFSRSALQRIQALRENQNVKLALNAMFTSPSGQIVVRHWIKTYLIRVRTTTDPGQMASAQAVESFIKLNLQAALGRDEFASEINQIMKEEYERISNNIPDDE